MKSDRYVAHMMVNHPSIIAEHLLEHREPLIECDPCLERHIAIVNALSEAYGEQSAILEHAERN